MNYSTEITVFRIEGLEGTPWSFECEWKQTEEKQVYRFDFTLRSKTEQLPPELSIRWDLPLLDTVNCWTTAHGGGAELPPDWAGKRTCSIADEIPELVFHNREGFNTAAAAFSDAMRESVFHGGIQETDCCLRFLLEIFRKKEAPRTHYHGAIRIDLRRRFFADIVRDFSAWYAAFPEYRAMSVPAAAFEPFYSTWYSYHHDVHDRTVLAECEAAVKLGMQTVIVDSGWDNDDNTLGAGSCGDWRPSKKRFPDFAAHVRAVHALGMRYMLWFAVPFIGRKSAGFERFRSRYLFEQTTAGVLDPRFPDVREFLINACRRLMTDYSIDGLKLDFINSFTECPDDPARTGDMGGRDIRTIPEGVDRLMTDLSTAIREIRPDALIEFRQCYIGPAIRKYGNILRAADCPADPEGNRRRIVNLRLTSGNTAVHSDMLEWRSDYSVQNAALQLFGIMFSVPQISVRLEELPEDHRRMLDFLLHFFRRHQSLLVQSDLYPYYPDHNYPLVCAESESERIAVVYGGGFSVKFDSAKEVKTTYLVNATGRDEIIAEIFPDGESSVHLRNCLGETLPCEVPKPGISKITMPSGSILKIDRKKERT